MDEVVGVLYDILRELESINSKLDDIRGTGKHSIDDVYDSIEKITENGGYNLRDVWEKLNDIDVNTSSL